MTLPEWLTGKRVAWGAVALFVIGFAHSCRVAVLADRAEASGAVADSLNLVFVAENAARMAAEARDSTSRAQLAAVRDSVATARADARAERVRAQSAGRELRSRVEAAASDSAKVVALVDSITTEHENEVEALEEELAEADRENSALQVRLRDSEFLSSQRLSALTVAEAALAASRAEADDWEAAYNLSVDPPALIRITRGSKWFALGAAAGWALSR